MTQLQNPACQSYCKFHRTHSPACRQVRAVALGGPGRGGSGRARRDGAPFAPGTPPIQRVKEATMQAYLLHPHPGWQPNYYKLQGAAINGAGNAVAWGLTRGLPAARRSFVSVRGVRAHPDSHVRMPLSAITIIQFLEGS